MKYYTLGAMFLLFSLITILISFYYINLIQPLENKIENTQLHINYLQDKIKINELEYAAHLSLEYLEKLEKIYFSNNYYKEKDLKIVGIQEFSFKEFNTVIKVASN